MTLMELSDTPRDEVLAGSRIRRRLTHATRSRKRSEGDELSLSDAVGAAPIIAHHLCAMRRSAAKG